MADILHAPPLSKVGGGGQLPEYKSGQHGQPE